MSQNEKQLSKIGKIDEQSELVSVEEDKNVDSDYDYEVSEMEFSL